MDQETKQTTTAAADRPGCTCRIYPTHRTESPDCPVHGDVAHRARLARAARAYAENEARRVSA